MDRGQSKAPRVAAAALVALGLFVFTWWTFQIDAIAELIPGAALLIALAAAYLAEKVLAAAADPLRIGDLLLTIGASVGLAFGEADGTQWRDLLKRAGERLHDAKSPGCGRFAGQQQAALA